MAGILKTTDYSIFKKHESNREMNSHNLKMLMQSIKSNNLLAFRPILVDEEMRVIDGQHRLEIAKDLGVEIYYQINKQANHEDIVFLNAFQKKWEMKDFINYYVSLGNPKFKQFSDYCNSKGFSMTDMLRFITGSEKDKHIRKSIKLGILDFFNPKTIAIAEQRIAKFQEVIDIIKKYSLKHPQFLTTYKFRTGLFHFLVREDVEFNNFINKLTLKMDSIKECATHFSYYSMFMDIYNYKRHNPIT